MQLPTSERFFTMAGTNSCVALTPLRKDGSCAECGFCASNPINRRLYLSSGRVDHPCSQSLQFLVTIGGCGGCIDAGAAVSQRMESGKRCIRCRRHDEHMVAWFRRRAAYYAVRGLHIESEDPGLLNRHGSWDAR